MEANRVAWTWLLWWMLALLLLGLSLGCQSDEYKRWKEEQLAGERAPVTPSESGELDELRKAAEEAGGVTDARPTQREKAQEKIDNAANAMGWIAGACAAASLLTLIASFFFVSFSRMLSAGCLAAALLGWGVQYLLLVYGAAFFEAAIWLAVVVTVGIALSTGLPLLLAWRSRVLAKTGEKLIAKGHVDAGVAMLAEALPRLLPDAAARKQAVADLSAAKS